MDIKYPVENEYMKCVLQINGFSSLHLRVWSNGWVGSGGATGLTLIMILLKNNVLKLITPTDQVILKKFGIS